MLRHLVVLTFTDATTSERVDEIVRALETLPAQIPVIESLVVGRDAGLEGDPGAIRIGIVTVLADAQAWRDYQTHPAHQRVLVEMIRPALAARTAIQFEA